MEKTWTAPNGKVWTIHHNDAWTEKQVQTIADHYKCKYIGEFTLKNKDGQWANTPVMVFWQETIPEAYKDVGSNYLGVYRNPLSGMMVTNAIKAVENEWDAVADEDGNVVYSAYRHDYQVWHGLMADGGPDYLRCNLGNKVVKLKIVGDHVEVMEEV